MNPRKALFIAIDCIIKEKRKIAPEAKMAELYHSDAPIHRKMLERYQELEDAVLVLVKLKGKPE